MGNIGDVASVADGNTESFVAPGIMQVPGLRGGLLWDLWGDFFGDVGGSKVDAEKTSKKGHASHPDKPRVMGSPGPKR